jgi:hypothetical protein
MPINVYLDNNVWDFLFSKGIDISTELPNNEFCLCLTREAEFEIPPIPEEKKALKEFIKRTIDSCLIETRAYFGFFDENHSELEQRVGGLDEGYLASEEEIEFINQQKSRLGHTKKIRTGLHKNEADISVAARSLHSIVLTLDRKTGPINDAYKNGWNVVFLNELDNSGLSLRNFIKSKTGA